MNKINIDFWKLIKCISEKEDLTISGSLQLMKRISGFPSDPVCDVLINEKNLYGYGSKIRISGSEDILVSNGIPIEYKGMEARILGISVYKNELSYITEIGEDILFPSEAITAFF